MIKHLISFISVFLLVMSASAESSPDFDQFFINKTMRIDYFHIGDSKSEIVTLDQIYQYGKWAGSRKNLIDNFNLGSYYVKIYDASSGLLIYSRGFSSYFGEYQYSSPAHRGVKRTFHESALIPFPKNRIVFELERRDKYNKLYVIFSDTLNPESVSIIRREFKNPGVNIKKVHISGDPQIKVDVVILCPP